MAGDRELTLRTSLRFENRDYDSPTLSIGQPARDDRRQLELSLDVPLAERTTAQVVYEHADNGSNLAERRLRGERAVAEGSGRASEGARSLGRRDQPVAEHVVEVFGAQDRWRSLSAPRARCRRRRVAFGDCLRDDRPRRTVRPSRCRTPSHSRRALSATRIRTPGAANDTCRPRFA